MSYVMPYNELHDPCWKANKVIQRVRELHVPTNIRGLTPYGVAYSYTGCTACWEQTNNRDDRTFDFSHVEYPCETIRVLDGEQ